MANESMQGIKNLTQGPINKQLFRLALPIMATSFIQMAYSLTDMAWVGRLGSEAVAVIGAVSILTWMTTSISLLNKVGAEVSVAQSIGMNSQKDASAFASHNICISLIISLIWGGILFVFADPILDIFKLAPDISERACMYLRIIALGFPFVFTSAAFTGIYNAAGRSNIPFYISGTGLILNMILDPLFIFVFDWGTNGAAIATLTAEGLVCALFIYKIRYKDRLLGGFDFIVRLKGVYTKRIFKLGLPVALFNTLYSIASLFLCRIASTQRGHIGLMAFTTGGQIEAICWNTSQGLSSALSAFVAQNYAAGYMQRVKSSWRSAMAFAFIFGVFFSVIFIFYGETIFSIFVPIREAYIVGGQYLRIDGYSMLFMMLEITMQGMFYGIGRTIPPAMISIVFNYMRIPLALLLIWMGLGIDGLWWAVCITTVLKGIISFIWFIFIRKRVFLSNKTNAATVIKDN